MTSWLIDTNCLVSYVTDRNASQRRRVAALVAEAAGLSRELVVLPHVLSEFVYTLQTVHGADSHTVAQMVTDLLRQPGITQRDSYDLDTLLEIWPERVRDYGDAVIAAAAISMDLPILTFDRRFGRELARLGVEGEPP